MCVLNDINLRPEYNFGFGRSFCLTSTSLTQPVLYDITRIECVLYDTIVCRMKLNFSLKKNQEIIWKIKIKGLPLRTPLNYRD